MSEELRIALPDIDDLRKLLDDQNELEKYSIIPDRQLCFTYSFPEFEYFLNTFETCF